MNMIKLSALQRRFWMDHQIKYPSAEYNETNYTFKIEGKLDLSRLQRAYLQLMDEYAPLRSRINVVEDSPYFEYDNIEDVKLPFYQIELSTDPSIHVDQWIKKVVNQPFDLSREYPCRFYALHDGELWYLVNIVNHVVIDGPSLLLFFERLSEVYNELIHGESVLISSTQQVIDANREFDKKHEQNKVQNLNYWKNYLADADTHSFFHYNEKKLEQEKNAFPFALGSETGRRVEQFCAEQTTTPFRFYSSTFAFALSKLSRTKQMLFDHTLNVRPEKQKNVPGVYMNHLPLKFDFENDNQTFLNVIEEANRGGEDEKLHALSFYNEILGHDEENAASPRVINVGIYPIVFSSFKLNLVGCRCTPYLHVDLPLSIDLVFVIENDQDVHCRIRYGNLLDPHFVRSLSEVFEQIIDQVLVNPSLALKDIQLLSEEKQQFLLERENAMLHAKEDPNTFLTYFKEMVSAHGNCPAVAYEGRVLTYHELDQKSDSVAAFLVDHGMVHQPIGLSTPKNCEMIVGILGIMKSGNVYIPVDYNLPEQRINMMMTDSQAGAMLITDATPVDFPSVKTFIVEDLSTYKGKSVFPHISPEDTAYIIYTSGTTGTPKGIPICHSTLYQTITTHIPLQQLEVGTRVMQFASVSFDASIIEMFPVLCAGGTLVLPRDIVRKDPELLFGFLKENEINMASIPPVLLSTLPHQKLPQLKTIMLGGDSATMAAIRYWNVGRRMVNSYGPAENGVEATYCIFDENSPKNDIGTTVPGVCCYVLDDNFHLMPDNAIGALYIGGTKLTKGYLNRPELNQEKFVPNPFVSSEDRAKGENLRLYNTGDLVIRQENGHLLFIGRSDFQVKLNGFRIELAEVETKIQEFDTAVKGTIVTVVEHGNQKQLVAYIKTDDPDNFPSDHLRQHLLHQLPVYMVPAILYPMADFPYNNSGKVDRKQLPIPTVVASTQSAAEPAVTPLEKDLVEIWETLLPGSVIGRNDDFISLGGDSLAIISMSFAIEQKWGVPIKASDIYKYIKLKDLAEFIGKQQQKVQQKLGDPSAQMVTDGPVPLSPSQMALWLHCVQSEQVKISYNCPCIFELPLSIDVQALSVALNRFAELQESFRMYFPLDEGGHPHIAIAPYAPFELKVVETTSEGVKKEVERQMMISFQLEKAPLYDVVLYKVDGEKYVFSMVMHHLISDGWSEQMIQDVLKKAAAGGKVDWSLYKGTYTPYARESNDFINEPEFAERMDYWKEQLANTSDLSLFKAKTGREDDNTAKSLSVDVPEKVAAQVAAFCQKEGNTPFEVFSAVYMRLLAKISKQNDFAIGFPYLGRESSAYHYVVGYFVNALPLCYKAAYNDCDFRQYLAGVKESVVEASTHSVSVDQLIKWYRAACGEQDAQLLQTMFVMAEKEEFYDYWTSEFVSHNLVFNVLTKNNKVTCYVEYRTACFSEEEVSALVSSYLTLLEGLISHPEAQITSHTLASKAYTEEVINENRILNHANLEAPYFLDLFAKHVKENPDHEAIAYGDESVTYGELEALSNQVVESIAAAHITEPTSIAINRVASIETLATMIGIFKAGCCYVPIDVELPEERRDFILQDARCSMVFDDETGLKGKVLHPEKTDLFDKGQYAYIIYTSGTTGTPKGVPIGHRALANIIDNMIKRWSLTTENRFLLFSSISFDASVTEMFPTLAAGATLVIAEQHRRKDIGKLADLIEQQRVTNTQSSSPILPLLPRRPFPCLKTLTVGGESIPVSVLEYWGSGHTMINAYGPTESTVSATFAVIGENYEANDIGTALDGVSCYILDENMNLVPANMEGELYLGGLQLTDGYLNRPELNIERFVKNPYVHPDDAAKGLNTILYKSGDIAMRRPNGHIIFIGRADRQVKWHGYRIELSEIEKHLLAYDEVDEAIVEIKKEGDREDLVAYIKSAQDIAAETLQERLFDELPYYMVPSKWAVLKEFPLTINGKTDKRRLPEPKLIVKDSIVEAATEAEKELLDDVRAFMGTDIIGVETDLLDAGMTSMQIMEWMVRIAQMHRYDITISSVYKNRTIRKMLKDHSEKNYLWANEYDEKKPVMVFICGFPDFHPLYDSFMERFKKYFSIFVFDSYNNYFADKEEVNLDVLLKYFLETTKKELKGKKIDVISGFCAGAEIAMHFGSYVQREEHYAPRVLMLEGTYDRSQSGWVNEVMSNEINNHQLSITSRLVQSFPKIDYREDVILCLAKKVTKKPLKNAEEITDSELIQQDIEEVERNNKNWNEHYAGFPIYMLDEDHWTFLESNGLDVIEQAVLKHWF